MELVMRILGHIVQEYMKGVEDCDEDYVNQLIDIGIFNHKQISSISTKEKDDLSRFKIYSHLKTLYVNYLIQPLIKRLNLLFYNTK
jgi:hypothetical protein